MLVSADSAAAFVRFVVAGQVERTVAVSGGSAVTEIPVSGLDGSTSIEAYDCATLVSCGVSAASITVDVELAPPTITAPSRNDVIGNLVTVKVKATYGAIRFFVDGAPVGKDLDSPYAKQISLKDRKDGEHILKVQQCNTGGSICEGETDTVKVIKDTKGPRFTDVDSSLGTVYPVNDNYKDTVKLSARVAEKSLETKVEIRKAGGPLVRTLNLGREDAGRLSAMWNGRKSNGDLAAKGKYLFRFVGTDVHGVVGKSGDKVIYVSDKRLVKKTVNKTVGALASGLGDSSGDCSRVVVMRSLDGYGRQWNGGLQWQSNFRRNCSGEKSVALSGHIVGTDNAIRYGTFQVSAYGGASLYRGGPAKILYIKKNETWGAKQTLSGSLGWHRGDRVKMDPYLIGKRGKLVWAVATVNGNFYDIKEFKISYTVSVLR